MKKWFGLFMVTAFLSLLAFSQVLATSWVELTAEEVAERADVIVYGTYDFSDELSNGTEMVFHGTEFLVKDIYEGESASQITVGIDPYDIGWVDEFQNDGGEFLLFLEEGEDFLLPVGGPNGMIQVQDGQVIDGNEEKRVFYQDIFESSSNEPNVLASSTEESNLKNPTINTLLYIGIIFIVGTILASWFKRYQRNKE